MLFSIKATFALTSFFRHIFGGVAQKLQVELPNAARLISRRLSARCVTVSSMSVAWATFCGTGAAPAQ
jgi:hypothetical protein